MTIHHLYLYLSPVQLCAAGRLWCAFDETYLTQTLVQTILHERQVLVGGAWSPEAEEDACLDMAKENLNIKDITKASSMMTFLAWDPCAMQKAPLTFCSLPVRHSFKGAEKYKGNWTILEIVGRIMESDARSGKTIRGLVFDAHGSHAFVRRVIFGDFEDV